LLEYSMDFFRIAARVSADYKSVGEPIVPSDTFKKAYEKVARKSEEAANAASESASDQDSKAQRNCVLLYQKAMKDWQSVPNAEKAKQMAHMAWEHDQLLKKLTGETFGMRKVF